MKYIDEEKLSKIQLTKNNFYVALDFDKTLTATESTDSWDASGRILGEDFKKEINSLYDKYSPIEQSYTVSFEEKFKAMEEWYYACMELYYKFGLTEQKLQESIDTSNLIFREGAKEFLQEMHINNIPVIVLSAGIGNVIQRFLKNTNCYYDNMFIISNFIEFDSLGQMKKYDNELIHTLNKTMAGKVIPDFSREMDKREYRLLLGDFIEDKNMVPKKEWDRTISVGFLGKKINENLEVYKKNFDIVLTERDASFNMIRKIIYNDL